ncbi:cytochrome P450 [Streptosporangium sp. CA-115845]|uniref:cytochrome P450 n=1 Tax=Streptosporangium sp. CA-115845 TaxID=3240071 RepID=UPI003D8F0C2E
MYGADFHADPIAVFRRLRAQGPVAPVWLAEGVRGYVVLDLATIYHISRDPQTWSRDSRRCEQLADGSIPADSELRPMMGWRNNLLFADGAEHTRLRQAVEAALSEIDKGALERQVRAECHRLIDAFSAEGRADLVADYAAVVPLRVVMGLFGLEPVEVDQMLPLLHQIWDGTNAAEANSRYEHMLRRLICRQRVHPGATITRFLEEHPADLSDEELLQHLVLLVGAAGAPTGNLIANALAALLSDGALRCDVAGQRTSILEAVHRVLWQQCPMQVYPFVYPVRNTTLGGHRIAAGTPVGMGITAANLGEADQMGGQMQGNRAHASFGAGLHRCPGEKIAMDITVWAITVLAERLPDLRLTEHTRLTWRPSLFAAAVEHLPASFTPSQERSSWTEPTPSPWPPAPPTNKQPASTRSGLSFRWRSLVRSLRGR